MTQGFRGGSVVKNLPAHSRDRGSIWDPGRSHMPRSNQACALQLLSVCSRARGLQLLRPRATTAKTAHSFRACAPHQEKVKVLVAQSCPTLWDPTDCSPQAPLSMEFSRQEYWSGLPFPSPGGRPNPGIEPRSPTLQADS